MERLSGKGVEERLKLRDKLEIYRINKGDNNYSLISEEEDLITTAGHVSVANLLITTAEPEFGWIAIGTSTIAPSAGQTTLGAEIATGGGSRVAASVSVVDTTVARLEATYNFTTAFEVKESGVFNAASAGDMLCRQTCAVSITSGDSYIFRWRIAC